MDKTKKGLEIFEQNKVQSSYKFRMKYGFGNARIYPNWKEKENELQLEKENERQLENERNIQIDRVFDDDVILAKDRSQMRNHIRKIINKTNLENDLKKNDMSLGLSIIIGGTPSIPTTLVHQSDYDERINL